MQGLAGGQGRRERDVGDVEAAAVGMSGVEEVADFRQAVGDRAVRPDGDPHDGAVIAVDSRGDVETEDGPPAVVQKLDDLAVQTADLPVEAGAEEGVHDPVGMQDVPADILQGFHARDRHGQFAEDLEMGPGRPLELARIPQGEDLDPAAPAVDDPRHDEPVAAVVADAAQDDESFPGDPGLPVQDGHGGQPGVLHEDHLRNAERFNGVAVHRPHLFDRGDFHAFLSSGSFGIRDSAKTVISPQRFPRRRPRVFALTDIADLA